MAEFKIRRGLSTVLFTEPGVVNPKLVIEEGCWYLSIDTVELFIGAPGADGKLTLRRVNSSVTPSVSPDEGATNIKFVVEELSGKVAALEDVELFQKIEHEEDLPQNFDSDEFNKNITYYEQLQDGSIRTYIYDNDTNGYLCTTQGLDASQVRDVVFEVVGDVIDDVLDEKLESKLPQAVAQTIETYILHGGDATPED